MLNISRCSKRYVAAAVLVLFCSASLTGCASFRRKFIRHNKNAEAKEDFIPVLEPVEYQRAEVSPMDNYKSHYAMVKAYFGDMYAALDGRDAGEKRERYLLGQIVAHIRGMAALLTDARKPEALEAALALEEAVKELDKPAGIRRNDLFRSEVHKTEMSIRRSLKPDMVKEFVAAQ